ncbi:MAG: xanthine dehydrogenase family protein molybdopterin-binding subunit [Boseongicola sp. SB0675_bin_26]|nr:xanthine dehydrogenase family protein molybdopterin-binding subunit [Boseongicola sp. SB0675_bin_26]
MTVDAPPPPLTDAPLMRDWIDISPAGGVTFLSGRVELGQGNSTALLMMVADELGVSSDAVTLETARTDRTPNEGFTAGSMSISFGGQALRCAASALLVQMLDAAGERLGCPPQELRVEDGEILRHGVSTGLELLDFVAAADLSCRVADLARPKAGGERWKTFRDMPRIDLKERLVGAPFVHDMAAPDMLHGAPVHPPSLHSALVSLDLDALMARPGVVEVVRDGSFVGVVADSPLASARAAEWAAKNGTWEATRIEAIDPVEVIAGSTADAETVVETGDVNRNIGRWYETTVTRPYIFHGSIGPAAAVAVWEGDEATVWTHSQGVFQLRKAMAMALRTAEEKLRVIHSPGAGCYGHNGADDVAFDALLMARAVPGRQVKVVWSRHDEFRAAPMGAAMATRVRALLGPDNVLTAVDVMVNSAPHTSRPGAGGTPNLRAAAYLENPIRPARSPDVPAARGGGADRNAAPTYKVDAVRVQRRLVHDLPYRSSALRSLGAHNNVIAIESLMDDIANDIGLPPLDFRLQHMTDQRSRDVLERIAVETREAREVSLPEGAGWGLGFARYKGTGGYCAVMVRIEVDGDVRVTDAFAVADVGEAVSPDGVKNQVEGGMLQSISWTLKEAVQVDGSSTTSKSWADYPILKFSEVPRVSVELVERPGAFPLGAGEISQGPTGAAVCNAVRAALGIRVRNLPITRGAIIAAANA